VPVQLLGRRSMHAQTTHPATANSWRANRPCIALALRGMVWPYSTSWLVAGTPIAFAFPQLSKAWSCCTQASNKPARELSKWHWMSYFVVFVFQPACFQQLDHESVFSCTAWIYSVNCWPLLYSYAEKLLARKPSFLVAGTAENTRRSWTRAYSRTLVQVESSDLLTTRHHQC